MRIHPHSIEAKTGQNGKFGKRERKIYKCLMACGRPMTDREVRDRLFGPLADMNAVRPRITELRDKGWIREVGAKRDAMTRKKVRLVVAISPSHMTGEQMELWGNTR